MPSTSGDVLSGRRGVVRSGEALYCMSKDELRFNMPVVVEQQTAVTSSLGFRCQSVNASFIWIHTHENVNRASLHT
jgi:hypothetical protein